MVNCVAREGEKLVELYNSVMDSTVVLGCLIFFFVLFNVELKCCYSVDVQCTVVNCAVHKETKLRELL